MKRKKKRTTPAQYSGGVKTKRFIYKEIRGINFMHLNNGAHFKFIEDVIDRLDFEKDLSAHPAVNAAAADLKAALKEESSYIALSQKHLSTDNIKELDRERDRLLRGYRSAVKAFLRMPVDDMALAAKELAQHLKDCSIDTRMQFDRESALISHLVNDCEGKYASQVERLGLMPYITALKTANDRLQEILYDRTTSDSTRIPGALRMARRNTDDAYLYLVKVVNAFPIYVNPTAADSFINYMNVLIKHYETSAKLPAPPLPTSNNFPTFNV